MMIKDLLHTIEIKTGLKMKYNNEFIQLSKHIFEATHEHISPTTLKRMWGYITDRKSEPRISTLNILANVVGFGSYEQFEQMGGGNFLKSRGSS